MSGDLAVGRPIIIIYDETNDRFVAVNFVAGGSGEISAADLHDPTGSIPGEITGRRARGLLNHVALTKAQAEDDTSVVKGTVDGKIISEAIDERLPDDQDAAGVAVAVTNFDGNLSSTDDDVQTALETIDDLDLDVGLSRQDENRLEQIPRLGVLTDDMREKNVARVWEAPANTAHGMAVFTGLVTPTDAELEAGTYVTPLTTASGVTTRILIIKVDLGDHPGDIRVRETGLPAGSGVHHNRLTVLSVA